MSGAGRFAAGSIEELLAGIADGVREAQEALSELPPVDAFGRPMPTYHLPYVDFEIAVDMTVENIDTATSEEAVPKPALRIQPLRAMSLSRRLAVKTLAPAALAGSAPERAGAEISSRITGRLVSVPPGDGVPIPQLAMSEITADPPPGSALEKTIEVLAANSAGEILSGHLVELNIDWDASATLSPEDAQPNRNRAPVLSAAELVTDAEGRAEAGVRLHGHAPRAAVYVIEATLGTVSVRTTLTRGEGG